MQQSTDRNGYCTRARSSRLLWLDFWAARPYAVAFTPTEALILTVAMDLVLFMECCPGAPE
ncbi:MAG: hypothetical protein QXS20_08680 [Candidatus Thorarchaeota archaeon]